MTDKIGNQLDEGDMVSIRIFDEAKQCGVEAYGFIEGFRDGTHVIIKVRKGRDAVYVFNAKVVKKVSKEEAMLWMLENA